MALVTPREDKASDLGELRYRKTNCADSIVYNVLLGR